MENIDNINLKGKLDAATTLNLALIKAQSDYMGTRIEPVRIEGKLYQ